MAETDSMPELKQILGALIFGSNRVLSISEMRKCLIEVAESIGEETAVFSEVTTQHIRTALEELASDLTRQKCGFHLAEVAGGYRLQSDAASGRWLKHLLKAGKTSRLSHPALETLAIIAYRQPVSRAEIETIRGVSADHMIRTLMELQLVKIAGRSSLPGKPFLYGTTHLFLEHFGLNDLKDLKGLDPLLLPERERKKIQDAATEDEQATLALSEETESAVEEREDAAGSAEDAEDES